MVHRTAARLCQQAEYMARWLSHSFRNREPGARGTALRVLHGDLCTTGAALARARNSRRASIPEDRPCSESADRGTFDGIDAPSISLARERIHSRHGDTPAMVTEATRH